MSVLVGLTVQTFGTSAPPATVILQGQSRTMSEVFPHLFSIFLVLGTLVGIVVLSYMVYVAVRYRADGETDELKDSPQLGELPEGGGDGRKLAVSLTLSAIIVIALISYAWFLLMGVEGGPPEVSGEPNSDKPLSVTVVGEQFAWKYIYPNGNSSYTLRVPDDRPIELTITSSDVMHTYGIPKYDLKTDAIPAQNTTTWFNPDETETVEANCYELCGTGHSEMTSEVIIMDGAEFDRWYAQTTSDATPTPNESTTEGAHAMDHPQSRLAHNHVLV
ncbi:cytochrome c oxidase subunit II [Halocatena halophila]|uniref:cytochrome c oxidase subunit II n=1 Tax=Halocatena halophila TaxID=2814576 RepID=UPI002ED236CA